MEELGSTYFDAESRLILSRREFIELLGATSIIGLAIHYRGVRLFPAHTVENIFGAEKPFRIITLKEISDMGRIVLDDWNFFTEDREIIQAHRAGNRIQTIDEAVKAKGANYIDLDANYFMGEVYTEHGKIYSLGGLATVILDPAEGKIRKITPPTFEQAVAHISSLSSNDNPLAINIELKHGYFGNEVLHKMFTILRQYEISATVQPGLYDRATIAEIYQQVAKESRLR